MRKKILISLLLVITILTAIFSTVYATDEQTEIPSKYDLRNDISINVENQGQRAWCNAYAITKTIQTYLQKTRGINYNLSEAYLAYSEAPYFGGEVQWKTDITTARALVKGNVDKYVLESEIPNQDYTFNETNKKKFENAETVIKSIEFDVLEGKEKIKNYIVNNGGVWIGIDGATKWYNSSTKAIYCNEKSNYEDIELNTREQVLKYVDETTAHAVTIIGWDDNYSRNNFNSNCRPENDGAWLILNSWGADWGNNGTAWVSYEDEATKTYQEIIGMGIKSVKLTGELNANFTYEFNKLSNTVIAKIVTDEKVESIEGWKQYSEDTYNKEFTEYFEPYTIELKSKIDGATTKVEVNIPNEIFEEQKANNEIGNKKAEQREKELEELRSEKEKRDLFLHNLDMIIYVGIGVLILVIVIFIFLSKNNKSKD